MLGGKSGKSGGGGSTGGSAGGFGAIIALAAILVVGYAIFQSFYTVDEQERAVVLRFGEYNRTGEPWSAIQGSAH